MMPPSEPPALGFERGLGLLRDHAERGRIAHRELREHLAVERDLGLVQAGDQLAVRKPLLARRRVDANDPQLAERALLVLAVAVGVMQRVLDLLLGVLVRGLLEPPVALRLAEYLAALLARVNGAFDPRHQ